MFHDNGVSSATQSAGTSTTRSIPAVPTHAWTANPDTGVVVVVVGVVDGGAHDAAIVANATAAIDILVVRAVRPPERCSTMLSSFSLDQDLVHTVLQSRLTRRRRDRVEVWGQEPGGR